MQANLLQYAAMKKIFQHLLKQFNRELRVVDSPTRSFSRAVELLKPLIAPKTIIDIGVADGTPDLYRHFPTHPYLLIEANPIYQATLNQLQTQINAIVEPVFCGAEPGEVQLNSYEDPRKSSRFATTRALTIEQQVIVPVATLDSLIAKHELNGPFLLKIDVEGAEIDVLKGATKTLQTCEAVIAEASVLPKYVGGPELADLVKLMDELGFAVFDIAAGSNIPNKAILYQVDLVFVKKEAPFRHQPIGGGK